MRSPAPLLLLAAALLLLGGNSAHGQGASKPRQISRQGMELLEVADLVTLMRKSEIDEDEIDLLLASDSVKAAVIDRLAQDQGEAKPSAGSGGGSAGWTKPGAIWKPPKRDWARRYDVGPQQKPQGLLHLGVWFVNTTVRGNRGSTIIINRALELGANIDFTAPGNDGATALLSAAVSGCKMECVNLLVEAGADWWIRNNDGYSVLDAASASAHNDVLTLMLEKGECGERAILLPLRSSLALLLLLSSAFFFCFFLLLHRPRRPRRPRLPRRLRRSCLQRHRPVG